jgi:hypothetical protein
MPSTRSPKAELRELVKEELTRKVDPRVNAMAQAIASQHEDASLAVLFYGSCLREKQFDGLMLDFYLIVSDYRTAYAKRWLAGANRLIPPNVFYFKHDGLVSKYAVLSDADFRRECSSEAWTVSTAARFAQPSRLAWSRNANATDQSIETVASAAPTLLGWTIPLRPTAEVLELWKTAFAHSFDAELRAERIGRSAALVDADLERYERFGRCSLELIKPSRTTPAAKRWWQKMQRRGKLYSVLRLAKASFTFAGGADYIAWKINRHSGADIRLKPWQQRHPLLAAISLLPRLLKSGAVR